MHFGQQKPHQFGEPNGSAKKGNLLVDSVGGFK
jgi:hypothetical protein